MFDPNDLRPQNTLILCRSNSYFVYGPQFIHYFRASDAVAKYGARLFLEQLEFEEYGETEETRPCWHSSLEM